MRFDDRLRTVLAQPASDPRDRAVRWRQLVELIARANGDADGELVEQALAAIRADMSAVDDRVRLAAALAVAPLGLPVDLVEIFAAEHLEMAAPVLANARLTASEWKRVSASASDECREFIAAIRSERPESSQSAPPRPPAPTPQHHPDSEQQQREPKAAVPSISDVVARIERLRQAREADSAGAAPGTQVEDSPRLFRWECNEAGEIDWVEGAPRGALIGRSIVEGGPDADVDRSVERAFAARTPFHERELAFAGGSSVSGRWKISGVPAFEPVSGRFAGYRGIAQRAGAASSANGQLSTDADSLRELAHEIKTPLNAIIGFAEIISGEYLGPAEGRYRDRAGEIVVQARLLLTAVEDLDLAARLRSGNGSSVAELADCVASAWDDIAREAGARGVAVNVTASDQPVRCAISTNLASRLVERLGTAVVGQAREGETLTFEIGSDAKHCTIKVTRPKGLNGADLRPDRNRRASDTSTLPLRLIMSLARTAGGELDLSGDPLILRLPKA